MLRPITFFMILLIGTVVSLPLAVTTPVTTTTSNNFTLEVKKKTLIPLGLTIPGYVKIDITWNKGSLITAIVDKNNKSILAGTKRLASPVTIIQEIKEADFKNGPISLELSGAAEKITGIAVITKLNISLSLNNANEFTTSQKSALIAKHKNAVKAKIEKLNQAQLATNIQLSSRATAYRTTLKNAFIASRNTRAADIGRLDNAQPVPKPGNIPIFTDVQPREILAGMTVTLTGTNFKNQDRVVFKKDTTVLGTVFARVISDTTIKVEVPAYAYDAYQRGTISVERPIVGGTEKSISKTVWYMPNLPVIQSFSSNQVTCGEDLTLNISGLQDTPVGTVIFKDERSVIRVTPTPGNWTFDYGVRVRVPLVSLNTNEGLKPFSQRKTISVMVEWDGKTSPSRQLEILPLLESKVLDLDKLGFDRDIKIAIPANQAASDRSKATSWIPNCHYYLPSHFDFDKFEYTQSDPNKITDTLMVTHKGWFYQGFSGTDKLFVGNPISPNWVIKEATITPTITINTGYYDVDNNQAGNAEITNSPVGRPGTILTEVNWWNQPVIYNLNPCAPTVRYTISYIGTGPMLTDDY